MEITNELKDMLTNPFDGVNNTNIQDIQKFPVNLNNVLLFFCF